MISRSKSVRFADENDPGPRNIIGNRIFRRQMSARLSSTGPSLLPLNKTYLVIIFSEKARLSTVQDIEKIVQEFGILTTLEILRVPTIMKLKENKWLLQAKETQFPHTHISNSHFPKRLHIFSKTEKHLYLSATTDNLLKLADDAELTKKTTTGSRQKFNYFSREDYLIGDMTEEDILRNSERPVLIKDAIKPSLLPYFRKGIIQDFFPLHEYEYLEKFTVRLGRKLPIEDIRNYFGASIGLYFAFIQFYTMALIVPSVFGILQYILDINLAIVCLFYVVWTTVLLETWKRRCSGLSYRWGTIEMTSLDTPRTAYYGILKPDPVTGKMTLQYPMSYTYMQMYCISYPVVLMCIIAAAYFALYQFQIEAEVIQDFGAESTLLYIPVIVQSILIAIFSWAYEKLATFLTDQENHRTRSQYDRHRVTKLMLFEIVNNFFPLFYIAFVFQDLNQLKYQLMMQLMIFQIVQIAQEVGFPLIALLKQKYTRHMKEEMDDEKRRHVIDMARYEQTYYESGLDKYNSTYEDYLQICTQFGYVVLFAAVAPFAALGALINNVFAMSIDLFKLTNIYKRPFARRAKNIGAWQSALELLSVMAIFSNVGLLYLQPDIRELVAHWFPSIPIFFFVAFEHTLLTLKYIMHKAIHDKPRWVRVAVAKGDYESGQALKHLRKVKATEKIIKKTK